MKSVLLLVIFSLFVNSEMVIASGTTIGNGGFALSCPNMKNQILDYYEAQNRGYAIKSIPGETLDLKVEFLLSKLESVDPNRAKMFRFQFNKMWSKLSNQSKLNIEGIHLNSVDLLNPSYKRQFGLGEVSIPQNCELVLAIQQLDPQDEVTVPEDRYELRTVVYLPVWNRLGLDEQAGLIVHELFYREYLIRYKGYPIKNSPINSDDVRYLNGLLRAEEFNNYNTNSWISELRTHKSSAMFPSFVTNDRELDFEAVFGISDFTIHFVYEKNPLQKLQSDFKGSISLNGARNLEIIPDSLRFLDGIYPNVFKPRKDSILDLSANSYQTLKLIADQKCSITIDRNLKIVEVGTYSYLVEYKNENLNTNGPIESFYWVNSETGTPYLRLKATQFSILKVKINTNWIDVKSVLFDLKSGHFELEN